MARQSWGVPGGKVEWGETLEAAAVREFQEEVGLELSDLVYVQTQQAVLSPEFHTRPHAADRFPGAHRDSEDVTPNEEIEEWAWVPLDGALRSIRSTATPAR